MGDWPHVARKVAIANGSANGASQGFGPSDLLLRYN